MQAIIQEILSRTQLEKIVQEFDLYPSDKSSMLEDRIERLRKTIKVEFRRNNVFQLSFESDNPETAKQVTGRLASLFIEQNLQVREQQAMGTKAFMSAEADRLRKELEEQEAVVNQYKAANRYELPDQQDSNLRTLEQLRREMEAGNQRLTALQERKGILQKQTRRIRHTRSGSLRRRIYRTSRDWNPGCTSSNEKKRTRLLAAKVQQQASRCRSDQKGN